ncbi:MAG: hypothetical protein AAFX55_12045 [Bacteroidota bacterium]
MTDSEIKYPILLLRENDNNLYGLSNGLGLISKGGESFYKRPIKLIDRDGLEFKLKSISGKHKARLIDSMRYFQPMEQLTFEFEQTGQLNLSELKFQILRHISAKPKHWISLGTPEMIEEWMNKKESIADLIKMFK